jgi:tetratricopeptide (TPR) repeat protein
MAWRVSFGFARLHHALGRVLEFCGWRGGAIRAYQDAVGFDPSYAAGHYRQGEVLGRRGEWQAASESFSAAARLKPQSVEFQGNLVVALHRAGRGEELAAALRRLTQLRPQEGEMYLLLGAVLRKLKRHHEAIRAFRWAVRLDPAPATKRFFLGETLLGPRGWQEVLLSWNEARTVLAAMPADDGDDRWSALNSRPGGLGAAAAPRVSEDAQAMHPLLERLKRLQETLADPDESFEAVLAREEQTRAILHGYREPAALPLEERPRKSGAGGDKRGA